MSVHVLRPVRGVAGSRRTPLVPPAVLAMLIFVFTEVMLFAGLISAFTIVHSSALAWPPPNQPRLPIEETGINTVALLASGLVLFVAGRLFARDPARARRPLLLSMLLGACFVLFQGLEWLALIGQGLTVTSSLLGSFFYLIVGLHGLHAAVALGVLAIAWNRLRAERLSPALFAAAQIFWYFVVGVWPVLYLRVYLA